MPLARYFLFVGGVLLALLFASNAVLPNSSSTDGPVAGLSDTARDLPTVRIASDRKWPERVVFDTSIQTLVPAPAAKTVIANAGAAVTAPTAVPEYSAKARERESFAQFRPSDDPKQPAPKQPKRKIAKTKVASPVRLVAQQPQFGLFGNSTW